MGLSEARARALGHDVDVFRTRFRPMLHTLTGVERRTMMKLVVDKASDRVLGCHMVGEDAAEIIQGFAVALTAGATKADSTPPWPCTPPRPKSSSPCTSRSPD